MTVGHGYAGHEPSPWRGDEDLVGILADWFSSPGYDHEKHQDADDDGTSSKDPRSDRVIE